jgi:hypothetical protein
VRFPPIVAFKVSKSNYWGKLKRLNATIGGRKRNYWGKLVATIWGRNSNYWGKFHAQNLDRKKRKNLRKKRKRKFPKI